MLQKLGQKSSLSAEKANSESCSPFSFFVPSESEGISVCLASDSKKYLNISWTLFSEAVLLGGELCSLCGIRC